MKKILLVIPLALLLLFSCDSKLSTPNDGKTILISVASDYSEDTSYSDFLGNTLNDQAGIVGQLVKLTGGDIEIHMFRIDDGKRYYVSGNAALNAFEFGEMEEIPDPQNPGYILERIKFNYKDDSTYISDWDMTTVANTFSNLDCGKNDLVVFYYSGHGMSKGQMIVGDGSDDIIEVNDCIALFSQYVPDSTSVMLIDACYSGFYAKDGILSSCDKLVVEGEHDIYKGTDPVTGLKGTLEAALGKKDTTGTPRLYALAASTDKQLSLSGSSGYKNSDNFSAMTFHLLRAMGYDTENDEPKAVSGNITFYGLYKGVWDGFSASMKKTQTPRATLSPIDIVLF